MEEQLIDIEALKNELIAESKGFSYPTSKIGIRQRYKETAYELHKKLKEELVDRSYLSFGNRKTSTVSNYGNTPIIMRRSISQNGEIDPYGVQLQSFGSLRGAPAGFLEHQRYMNSQFGSLRGLPADVKRLSKFDEKDEDFSRPTANQGSVSSMASSCTEKPAKADVWNDTSSEMKKVSTRKQKGRGLFKRVVKADSSADQEKSQLKTDDESVKSKTILSQVDQELKKSVESLVSLNKKRHWFFRRKKSIQDSESQPSASSPAYSENIGVDSGTPSPSERITLSSKAASEDNIRTSTLNGISGLEDDLRHSQILLKGYSQKSIAGVTNRSPVTNQTVTSRRSLTGSDVILSESSKSFMQYELPRDSSHASHGNITERVREGRSYEDQLEKKLDKKAIDSDVLCDNQSPEHVASNELEQIAVNVYVKSDVQKNKMGMEGLIDQPNTISIVPVNVDAQTYDSVEMVLGKLPETNIDDVLPLTESAAKVVPQQLSPDSRPIRPLQISSPTAPCPSPPMLRQLRNQYSPVSGAQECYPHSLLDKPVPSRLLAKRLSGADCEAEAKSAADSVRRSNIAYTLTFQDEPICVNVRTKSQSVTPEPYSNNHDDLIESKRLFSSSTENSSSKTDISSSGRVCERKLSSGDDRETSPGYRMAFTGSKKSPSISKKSGLRLPKPIKDKPQQASPTNVNNVDSVGADKTNVELSGSDSCVPDVEVNGDTSCKLHLDLSALKDKSHVHTIVIGKENSLPADITEKNDDNVFEEEKSGSKLQRRNTFTLPKPHEHKIENGDSIEIVNLDDSSPSQIGKSRSHMIFDNSTLADDNSPDMKILDGKIFDCSQNIVTGTVQCCEGDDSSQNSLRRPSSYDSPSLPRSGGGSKIPVRRSAGLSESGGRLQQTSRIPTMVGPRTRTEPELIATTPERSSACAKKRSYTSSPNPTAVSKVSSPVAVTPTGIPTLSGRKNSIADTVAAARLGAVSSPVTNNFLKTDHNTIVVKRETFLELTPEVTSRVCSIM